MQTDNNQATHGFRADIEGLRGISVGAVVLFHVFPATLPGGFIGVDIFFVISGFLITQILLREIATKGSIDLLGFWTRRIRRILPAAIFVLLATAVAALLVPAIDARLLGRHIVAASLFYYNWRQVMFGVDYLAEETRDVTLLHYWSLSVEEQFYLVWPLLLTILALAYTTRLGRVPNHVVGGLVVVLGTASFALGVYTTFANGPLAFFSTFTRAWQLLTGALIAVILVSWPADKLQGARYIGSACLLSLLLCFYWISEHVPYPGLIAAIPTISAALLILFGKATASWSFTVLSFAPLRYIGLVSFSWYLWHWPVLVVSRYAGYEGLIASYLVLIISFCLAVTTYHLIEAPARFNRFLVRSKSATIIFGIVLTAIGAATGAAMRHWAPDDVHLGGGVFESLAVLQQDRPRIYRDECVLDRQQINYRNCEYGFLGGHKTVVLFGDSHAANWFPPLDQAAKTRGWRLFVRIKGACRPIDAPQFTSGRDYHECATWRAAVIAEIEQLRPDLVIVASLSDGLSKTGEQTIFSKLSRISPVVIMRDTPRLAAPPTDCLRQRSNPDSCTWKISNVLPTPTYPSTTASDLPPNARILDLNDRICPQGICSAVLNGLVPFFDPHHLSARFSITLSDEFERLLAANPTN